MTLDEYRSRYADAASGPGWQAIANRFEALYGNQEPVHYIGQSAALGGADPLNGVSVYASDHGGIPHLHCVTYGFSNLFYDVEAFGKERSGFGFEMTFRLKAPASKARKQAWVAAVFQNLARYVFTSGNIFEPYHFLSAQGPVRRDGATAITAFAFIDDPELDVMDTPHGAVSFLQVVGLTTAEFESQVQGGGREMPTLLESLRVGNPLLVTDLARR